MDEKNTINNKNGILKLIVIFAVVIFFGIGLQITSPAIASVLNKYDLLPRPETFTELYFENHLNLPSKVEAGQTYTFSYTVHNVEYKNMMYPYSVYIQTSKSKIPVIKGSFNLPQDGKKTLQVSFIAPNVTGRSEVVVDLVNLNQAIDFWITE
jgi:hypothetical protein